MYDVDQYTLSLLHFEDGIKDEMGNIWTSKGDVAISAAQSKFGKSALFLEKDNTSISTPSPLVDVCKTPFTIEMWVFPTKYTTGTGNQWAVLAGMTGFKDEHLGSVLALFKDDGSGRILTELNSTLSKDGIPLNAWSHVAVSFDGKKLYYFINGQLEGTSTNLNITEKLGDLVIGATAGGWTYQFNGYIDEIRISNIARWISDFDCNKPEDAQKIHLDANGGDTQVPLSWSAVTDATGYNVKRSTTPGGPYTVIANNVTRTSYVDTAITNGMTYYYVVTAVTAAGESANSNEASATPNKAVVPVPSGNVLLRIVMNDSSEREYKLAEAEATAFVNWCKRSVNTGDSCYLINDTIDGSVEYLMFEKIISFKVLALAGK